MKSTDSKKPLTILADEGAFNCRNQRKSNMSNLTQKSVNPNSQPLLIGNFTIRQDGEGRYCLNDLHKASGGQDRHKPKYWTGLIQTKELVQEVCKGVIPPLDEKQVITTIHGGNNRGTFVAKELVYSYAMWISAKFHLIVIRAYDAMVMQWKINDRQSISPEQQALLHEIVDRRSQGNRKIYAEMWSRHNRHFKIPRYAELLEIHFPEAIHYLETMELKAKIESKVEKPEIKTLPYPVEVVHVAQQINQEYGQGKYKNWFVSVRDDGILSVQPLNNGYYPMNVAEFTKRFDGVLDYLYGSDLLRLGRYLQNN